MKSGENCYIWKVNVLRYFRELDGDMEKLVQCLNPNKLIRILTFVWFGTMLLFACLFIFIIGERNIVLGVIFTLAAVIGPVRALRDFPVFYVDEIGRVYARRYFRSRLIEKERISDRGKLTMPVYPVYAPDGYFISIGKENNGEDEDTFYILGNEESEIAQSLYKHI
ncbi:MAG: hypothetical protein GY771_06480 [bacterium]|nr:hypothetical protein [bacterium]